VALPDSRNETWAAGGKIYAATINDLQDGEIDKKHGTLYRTFHALDGVAGVGSASLSNSASEWTIGSGDIVRVPLIVNVGDKIAAATFYIHDNNGSGIQCGLECIDDLTGLSVFAGAVTGTSAGSVNAREAFAVTANLPHVCEGDAQYWAVITGAAAGQKFYHGKIKYNRP
jgi:hypothetical protein